MKYAVNLNAALPIRADAGEKSEMISQMLFGEICKIETDKDGFALIVNQKDDYKGWADKKMLSEISEDEYITIADSPNFVTCAPIADLVCKTDNTVYRLSAGSILPMYDIATDSFRICNKTFSMQPSLVSYLLQSNKENIKPAALMFMNAPYLWGGKTIFGIDCSGFVQTVYGMCGFQLPRDSSQQQAIGETVDCVDNAEVGDLIFFKKNNRITHVGIYLGEKKIIHASGRVKIEDVDDIGIVNEITSAYSHTLHSIKRIG